MLGETAAAVSDWRTNRREYQGGSGQSKHNSLDLGCSHE
jgi:hypothetical protein